MRDVAALAGVGLKTVSRVVNGERGVSPALTSKVLAAVESLDFQADMAAGNLRRTGRRSLSIGLVLAGVDNPFDAAVHRAVEDVAEARGVAVLSASTDEDPARERALAAAFTARRVDGLILTPTGADLGFLAPELASGTPVVAIDRPPPGIDVDSVAVDNADGAALATDHLLRAGHRRIAYLGDLLSITTAQDRSQGYRTALRRAGVEVDGELVVNDLHDERAAAAAVDRLLAVEEPPTALFTSQNLVTIGAVRALRRRGAQHTTALVGFDDFVLADLLEPAVTVVAQDPTEIGRAAARRVFDRLAEPGLPATRIVLPVRLLQRGSGEIRPELS